VIGLLVLLFAGVPSPPPSQNPRLDVRLQKSFGRVSARADLLNVTNREWEEVGLALPDLSGELVPDYFPAAGFTARLTLEWRF
jgi:outer membrane receptor protein involved in Fe transport